VIEIKQQQSTTAQYYIMGTRYQYLTRVVEYTARNYFILQHYYFIYYHDDDDDN
jgi:hypothetical protein